MTDRFDDKVRAFVAELVDDPPPVPEIDFEQLAPPPFQPVDRRQLATGPAIAVAAFVLILATVGVVGWLWSSSDIDPASPGPADTAPTVEDSQSAEDTTTVPGEEEIVRSVADVRDVAMTDGVLWLATDTGVVRWNLMAGSAVLFTEADGIPPGPIDALFAAPDDTVWLVADNRLARYDDAWTVVDDQSLYEQLWWAGSIGAMTVGADDVVWIAADMDLLVRYDGVTASAVPLPRDMRAGPWALSLDVASDGTLWAGPTHEASVYAYDGETWTIQTADDGVPGMVANVAAAPDGTIWVGTQGIYGDPDGDTLPAGVARFDGADWTVFTTSDGLASDEARVFTGPDGTVWALHPEGVSRFDGNSWVGYPELGNGGDAAVDEDGTLWMASSSGVVGFDGTTTTRLPLPSVVVPSPQLGNEASDRARGLPLDFAVHDICEWFTEAEMAEIVESALTVDQSVYLAMSQQSTPGVQHDNIAECEWSFDKLGLLSMVLMPSRPDDPEWPHQERDEFTPHAALSDGAVVGNLSGGIVAYMVGVQADIAVDGRAEIVGFTYLPPPEIAGAIEDGTINGIGLAIAGEMLHRMNWLPVEQEQS